MEKLLSNERSRNIISGIMKLSDDLHFRVVAEYVKHLNRQVLLELGCKRYISGYYYSRPVPD